MFQNKNTDNNKSKSMSQNPISKERNIISQGTKLLGTINSEGDFRVDGILEGDIDIKGKLVVGKTGIIEGKIKASNMDIEGNIKGNILIKELLSLKSTAIINGDVKTGKLIIDNGAVFNVTCDMGGEPSKGTLDKKEITDKK